MPKKRIQPEPEIDFNAVVTPPPLNRRGRPRLTPLPDPLQPKRRRGRPQIRTNTGKSPKSASSKSSPLYNINNINNDGFINDKKNNDMERIADEVLQGLDIKGKMTDKELAFIEIYLTHDMTEVSAMKLAGYTNYSENYIEQAGKRIIRKHEQQTDDHRKIMRAMGYGEIKIIRLLIDSAEKAKSETVKLNARIALAKCLGIQKEVLETIGGVQIIMGVAPALPGADQQQQEEAIDITPLQPKTLSITK